MPLFLILLILDIVITVSISINLYRQIAHKNNRQWKLETAIGIMNLPRVFYFFVVANWLAFGINLFFAAVWLAFGLAAYQLLLRDHAQNPTNL